MFFNPKIQRGMQTILDTPRIQLNNTLKKRLAKAFGKKRKKNFQCEEMKGKVPQSRDLGCTQVWQ
jgi:hypothetical protein